MNDEPQKVEGERPVPHIRSTLIVAAARFVSAALTIAFTYLASLSFEKFANDERLTALARYMTVITSIAVAVSAVFVTTLQLYKSRNERRRHAIAELRIKEAQLFKRISEELNSLVKERYIYAERRD